MLRRMFWIFCGLTTGLSASAAESSCEIRVAGYEFPPYVIHADDGVRGLAPELVERLDEMLHNYCFEFVEMASRRRFEQFAAHGYDLMLFESPQWGWQDLVVDMTAVLARDRDIYVAHRRAGRDQSFFENIHERRLLGYLGYHYGFADLETDSEALETHFDILLSRSHERNLQLILLDRADVGEIAILTESFLNAQLAANPEYKQRLLISEQ